MIHSFDTDIAGVVGVHGAILYEAIRWWCVKHKVDGTNHHDGNWWVFNSRKAWQELFPYMSEKNIRTALDKLVSAGLVLKGSFNDAKFDRTNWYAIADISKLSCGSQPSDAETATRLAAIGQCIGPYRPTNTIISTNFNREKIKNNARARETVIAEVIAENTQWVENQVKSGVEEKDVPDLLDYAYDHLVNMGEQPTRQSLMRCAHYKLREFNEHKRRQSLKAVPMDKRRMQFWEQSQRYSSQFSKELRDAFVLHYTQASGEDPSLMVYEQWPNFDMLSQLKKWQIKNERKTAI